MTSKPRLLLINPRRTGRPGFEKVKTISSPPLGLGYLAAYTSNAWEVELLDENFERFAFKGADLVGITATTASINRAYEIAAVYRKQNIPVVMGGIHSSMLPEETREYADSLVIGEAESVWGNVLSDFEKGKLKNIYQGGRPSLVGLKQPRRDLFSKDYKVATIQTSRGCPMNCDFCSVTAFNGGEYRQRPVEEVLDELKTLPEGKLVFFVDDNLLGYGKGVEERAIRLFRGMIEQKIKRRWWTQTTIDFADNEEVLKYAARSGCLTVLIGLESLNEATLKKDMHKGINLKHGIDNYKRAIKKLHQHGIGIIGSMIVGNDEDTRDTFKRTADFILDVGIDVASIGLPTPFPGTKLFKRLSEEKRLIYDNFPEDWKMFYVQNLTFKPRNCSIEDIYKGLYYIKRRIYSPGVYQARLLKTLLATKKIPPYYMAAKTNKTYRWFYTNL